MGIDAITLGQIGAALANVDLPKIEVRLPGELARRAVDAWERDDNKPIDQESDEQRSRAAAPALLR